MCKVIDVQNHLGSFLECFMFHHSPPQLREYTASHACVMLSPHYARLSKIMRDDGIVYHG